MIPRFGAPPLRGQRYTPRPGVYAVLRRRDELLLTFEHAIEPEFQLPGGGIDPGESPLQALHREVLEETGWTISRPRRMGAFRRFVFMPEYEMWAEKLCHIYCARPATRLGPPREAHHDAVWAPIDIAARLLGNPGDRSFVARLRAARPVGDSVSRLT